jgi:hypothetical protein
MQVEAGLKGGDLACVGINQADPGELSALNRAVLRIVQAKVPQAMALRIHPGRSDRHPE